MSRHGTRALEHLGTSPHWRKLSPWCALLSLDADMEHRYQPMHKPRREVSQEDMTRTLEKHANPSAKVSEAVESPKEKLLLQWQPAQRCRDGVYIMRSVCERYSIHAQKAEKGWRYEALRCTAVWNNVLGWRMSKEEAIDLCEKHALAYQATAPSTDMANPEARTAPAATE
jgi:hypothetical protein